MSGLKALFVDDDESVLAAFKRILHNEFDFDVVGGGAAALEKMKRDGPFAVIVSDMQMPGMDGLTLLRECRAKFPDTIRIMLTGDAGQQTAVGAINDSDVFRFLNKPISSAALKSAVWDAFDFHRTITAEREILERTLVSTIDVLSDILALVKPTIFGPLCRIRELAMRVCDDAEIPEKWQVNVAVTLSQMGCIALPDDLIHAIMESKTPPSDAEQRLFDSHYLAGSSMFKRIPRLETIAESVRLSTKNFDGSGDPADQLSGTEIPIEARILRLLLAFDGLECRSGNYRDALHEMSVHKGCYDPVLFKSLVKVIADQREKVRREVSVTALREGMQIGQAIHNKNGVLLIASGQNVTPTILNALIAFHESDTLASNIVTIVETAHSASGATDADSVDSKVA